MTRAVLLDLEREAFLKPVRRAQDARANSAHAENRQAAAELTVRDRRSAAAAPPLVLFPAFQGRWEWMRRPSTRWRDAAASSRSRCATTLGSARRSCGSASTTTSTQIGAALDERRDRARGDLRRVVRRSDRAAFAAAHPERTAALVLVSAPAARARRCRPQAALLHACAVAAGARCSSPRRRSGCVREIGAARRRRSDCASRCAALRSCCAPVSPARMARRVDADRIDRHRRRLRASCMRRRWSSPARRRSTASSRRRARASISR